MLDALKVHPRDQAENSALLARANRCFEENLGDVRQDIGQWIGTFEKILEQQNPREIAEARGQLQQLLDRVDGETFL
jgi:molecular chaperone HscC